MFALAICQAAGIKTIITSSSDEKIARIKRTWPKVEGINYKTSDQEAEVARITDGKGVDVVVNNTGVASLITDLKSLRMRGGVVSLVGFLGGMGADWGHSELYNILFKNAIVKGIVVGSKIYHQRLIDFLEEHEVSLQPLLDRTFSFEDSAKAFEHLYSGDHIESRRRVSRKPCLQRTYCRSLEHAGMTILWCRKCSYCIRTLSKRLSDAMEDVEDVPRLVPTNCYRKRISARIICCKPRQESESIPYCSPSAILDFYSFCLITSMITLHLNGTLCHCDSGNGTFDYASPPIIQRRKPAHHYLPPYVMASGDPFLSAQADILALLAQSRPSLSSYLRIRSSASSASSPELVEARQELEGTLTDLSNDLQDLVESVKAVEGDPYRYGLEIDEVSRRRKLVEDVGKEVASMRQQLSQTVLAADLAHPDSFNTAGEDDDDYGAWEEQRQMEIMHEQDEALDGVFQTVGNLRQQADTMGRELEEQAELLDEVDGITDRVGSKLGSGIKRMRHVIEKNEGKSMHRPPVFWPAWLSCDLFD
nr:t-snare affecting a late golgi compartment protein 1 [Quercus suber]